MRRKLVSRRIARFTPAMIEAQRRMREIEAAVKACGEARDAAEKRAKLPGGSYAEYHSFLALPCGESCVCQSHHEARARRDAEFMRLGIRPWDCNGETEFEELMAELDRLASAAPADDAQGNGNG